MKTKTRPKPEMGEFSFSGKKIIRPGRDFRAEAAAEEDGQLERSLTRLRGLAAGDEVSDRGVGLLHAQLSAYEAESKRRKKR